MGNFWGCLLEVKLSWLVESLENNVVTYPVLGSESQQASVDDEWNQARPFLQTMASNTSKRKQNTATFPSINGVSLKSQTTLQPCSSPWKGPCIPGLWRDCNSLGVPVAFKISHALCLHASPLSSFRDVGITCIILWYIMHTYIVLTCVTARRSSAWSPLNSP